ncbi:MAG TPA: SDR family oxidoreductase [Pseudonocardiaceae bacterium]|jgi:NAD(P)-dependent dehydrogenase (short-subunit alcohol dehydrogenase family)
MSQTLDGRTVLVIDRESGIAGAVTRAVRAAGGKVVVAGRDGEKLAKAYADDAGVSSETVDLTDEASVAGLAERVGGVDHVVSTASMLASFDTKVLGPILLAKYLAPNMPKDGSFVLFSGATARKPVIGMLAVAATNGAVDVVTRSLAVELAPIRVNAVSPGTIDTGAYDALGDEKKAALFDQRAQANPARRIGNSEDIAEAVLFALTNTFVTGISIGVDGGEPLV